MKKMKKYQTPVITRVKFEDKELVSFDVCKKQTQIERDSASCCNIIPNGEFNLNNFDAS